MHCFKQSHKTPKNGRALASTAYHSSFAVVPVHRRSMYQLTYRNHERGGEPHYPEPFPHDKVHLRIFHTCIALYHPGTDLSDSHPERNTLRIISHIQCVKIPFVPTIPIRIKVIFIIYNTLKVVRRGIKQYIPKLCIISILNSNK